MIAAYDPTDGRVRFLDADGMNVAGLSLIAVGPDDEAKIRGGTPYFVAGGVLVADAGMAMANLRQERDRRLTDCDWTQLPDAPLSTEQIGDWRTYRQQLRDLPESAPDPWNPIWPARPDST